MARDAFHAVKSMSILCLWDIQLTFDRNGVGTYGAYHHKSELKRCNRVQYFFNPPKFAVVIAILEPENSTRSDNSFRFFGPSAFLYIPKDYLLDYFSRKFYENIVNCIFLR